MAEMAPGELPGTRQARGPAAGRNYHSFCSDCHRVRYNIWQHGPMTPFQHNRTFCVCQGLQTGMVEKEITMYDLEDVLDPIEAEKERKRQGGK